MKGQYTLYVIQLLVSERCSSPWWVTSPPSAAAPASMAGLTFLKPAVSLRRSFGFSPLEWWLFLLLASVTGNRENYIPWFQHALIRQKWSSKALRAESRCVTDPDWPLWQEYGHVATTIDTRDSGKLKRIKLFSKPKISTPLRFL